MRLRSLAVLAAAGLFVAATLAQHLTPPTAPAAAPPRTVTSPKPCDAACPAKVTLPSPQYLESHPTRYFPEKPAFPPSEHSYREPIVKAYAVADLVVPPPPVGGCCPSATDKPNTCERELINRITTNVEPKSWSAAGGSGTIEYYPLGMALVVNQTAEVQTAVARYLDSLRQLQDLQIVSELRLMSVSDEWFENSGLAKEFSACKDREMRAKLLSSKDLERLMRSVQEDAAISVIAAPRITTLNGQPGRIRVGQAETYVTSVTASVVKGNLVFVPKSETHELGIDFTFEPTIPSDGKGVQMAVRGAVRELGETPVRMIPVSTQVQAIPEKGKQGEPIPFTQYVQDPKIVSRTVAGTVMIPDTGTALLYGGKATIEETVKEVPPTLSDVPVLADLFARDKKVTRTNHLVALVTTYIVRAECDVEQCAACCKGDSKLAKLLADYQRACAQGRVDDARRMAIECLAIDPTCFGKK
jgi:hypothetical protein